LAVIVARGPAGPAVVALAQDQLSLAELLTPVALPEQRPMKERRVKVARDSLWYWDTGGDERTSIIVTTNLPFEQPSLVKYSILLYVDSEAAAGQSR